MRRRQFHRSSAQSILETVVGIIFLIPIILLMFDVGVLVIANSSNDNLAKRAARAAAGAAGNAGAQPGDISFFNNARTASLALVTRASRNSNPSGMWAGVQIVYMAYHDRTVGGSPNGVLHTYSSGGAGIPATPANALVDPSVGNVSVVTAFRVNCPVAFPGFDGTKTFFAKAVEPIVAQPPF